MHLTDVKIHMASSAHIRSADPVNNLQTASVNLSVPLPINMMFSL